METPQSRQDKSWTVGQDRQAACVGPHSSARGPDHINRKLLPAMGLSGQSPVPFTGGLPNTWCLGGGASDTLPHKIHDGETEAGRFLLTHS